MRKTYLDLDQESTIISMLAVRELRRPRSSSKNGTVRRIGLGCAALLLMFVLVQASLAWQ